MAEKDSSLRLFPLDTVLEYAQRYFNLTSLDVTKIPDGYYNPEKNAFTFNLGREKIRPSYTDYNGWGVGLDKVTRNKDGTVTAVLIRYDSYQTRRVQVTKTYTLKERNDGSLYFVSGVHDYVNNHLISLSGAYQRFDQIQGFTGNIEELSLVGEYNNRLIIANTSYNKKKNAALLLLNPQNMKVEKKIDLKTNLAFPDVRLTGEKIVVLFKDKIITFAKTLEQLEEVHLPEFLKSKIEWEPRYDEGGFPEIYFGGYDVSNDL